MSVIIRLQNLPWSANAMDIRNFFRGLSIPEGGVHIVGGEQGDAFIAFSTDEDARQGMLNNGGRLKEVQVKLLLSSRSEMLKVIETARQAVTFMQLASQPALPAQPIVTQSSPIPSAITGLLAQNLKQLQHVPGLPLNNILAPGIVKPTDNILNESDIIKEPGKTIKDSKFERRRTRSSSRERHKKDRSRDGKKEKRDRSRSRDRSRDRDRRRRDRSRSRERRDRKRDRKDRSRERDRSKDRNDRYKDEKKVDGKDVKINPYPNKPVVNQINKNRPGLPASTYEPAKPFAGGWASAAPILQPALNNQNPYLNPNPKIRVGWNPDVPPQMIETNSIQVANPNSVNTVTTNNLSPDMVNNTPSNDTEQSRLKELGERRNPNAFQPGDKNIHDNHSNPRHRNNDDGHYGRGNSRFRPNYNNRYEGGQFRGSRFRVTKNSCLKVSNMTDRTLYKDIRRFFVGLFIPNSGLKLINDQYGKYTGVAYVRFSSPEDKFEALKRSGRILNGHNVVIEHLDDSDYDAATDLFVPNRRDSPGREEDVDSSQDLIIVENEEDSPKDLYKVLFLEDLPPFAKEHDIMKMFSDYSLLSILISTTKDVRKQYGAYVQFVHASDAKAALMDKSKHLIGHIAIKVAPCSDSAYEQAKLSIAEQEELSNDDNMDTDTREEQEMDTQPPPELNVSRDPRQRRFENKPADNNVQFNNSSQFHQGPLLQQPMQSNMFAWRPPNQVNVPNMPNPNAMGDRFGGPNQFNGPPQRPSRFNNEPVLDSIFIKGLPLSATDKDVLNLFGDINVTPSKIHLMLTLQGEPSGDCFCEFLEPQEAASAISKNGGMVGINRVAIELVPKSVVNDALGIPNNANHFMGDTNGGMARGFRGGRGGPPFRGRGRGRGGRDFHSRGGRGGFGNGPPVLHSNEATEGFGSPGTVVSLENVPYRATIEEILDFFCDFNVSQQDIIRRFNENGQPTGDARVKMHNTFDAQKAVNMLNMRKMRDRTVTLSILQSNN